MVPHRHRQMLMIRATLAATTAATDHTLDVLRRVLPNELLFMLLSGISLV